MIRLLSPFALFAMLAACANPVYLKSGCPPVLDMPAGVRASVESSTDWTAPIFLEAYDLQQEMLADCQQ